MDPVAEYYIATNKLIYQAGVDFESKPILVFCAANLPDHQQVDYDNLLDVMVNKLDEFCDNDYTFVLFVGGAKHKPSWTWLIRAYRRLGYKYKKNLKNLHIVHPAPWFQILFDVMNKLISPKFAKKVNWIKTLTQLAQCVPISHMNIPNVVYEHNRKFEDVVVLDPNTNPEGMTKKLFSIPLEQIMGPNGEKGLPKMVKECMEYILENGMDEEGVFRRSPSSKLLKEAKNAYDEERKVDLNDYGVHVAAVLLKVFVRELSTPLIPPSLYETIQSIDTKQEDMEICNYISENIISKLSNNDQQLFKYLSVGLNKLTSNCESNKMTSSNLAIVWTPNLLKSGNPALDVLLCKADGPSVSYVFKLAVDHPDWIFAKVSDNNNVNNNVNNNDVAPPKPPRAAYVH